MFRRLTNLGVPPVLARVLLWAVAVLILVAAAYVAFWLVFFAVFVFLLAKGVEQTPSMPPPPEPELRAGPLGVGLYDHTDTRIDMFVPSDDD